jgi:hypothetical protein
LKEIYIKIVLKNPVLEVLHGLQKGAGSSYSVEQKQLSTEGESLFFEVKVSLKFTTENEVDFKGGHVQGPKGQRFIYLNIGQSAGQFGTVWSRRMKIPLGKFYQKDKAEYEVSIDGTMKDGSPTCGTVKEFLELK